MSTPRLSTTAIAVLGLVGIRPMTGYEITQVARRTYRYLWPREESVLYEQPRKLEALGLLTGSLEPGKRRPRTRYTITQAGRDALAQWLATPAVVPFDFEPAVRLILADQGTHKHALATLNSIGDWARTSLAEGLPNAEGILDGTAAFPDRHALNGINTLLVADLLLALLRWSTLAHDEMSKWESPSNACGREQWKSLLSAKIDEVRAALEDQTERPE